MRRRSARATSHPSAPSSECSNAPSRGAASPGAAPRLRPLEDKEAGMSEPIIELSGIKKSFGPVTVLKGVDLKVHPGTVTALVGDNGAGKSTLIKGLDGVQPSADGAVLIDGTHRDL